MTDERSTVPTFFTNCNKMDDMLYQNTMTNIRTLAEEVRRQGDGPLEVVHMIEAWEFIRRSEEPLFPRKLVNEWLIKRLANIIKPDVNVDMLSSYRRVPVTINGIVTGVQPNLIESAMDSYYSMLSRCKDPVRAYMEFEKIHPFKDGNGRVGFFIYNVINDSLNDLVVPPKYNPLYSYYK